MSEHETTADELTEAEAWHGTIAGTVPGLRSQLLGLRAAYDERGRELESERKTAAALKQHLVSEQERLRGHIARRDTELERLRAQVATPCPAGPSCWMGDVETVSGAQPEDEGAG